MFSFNWSFQYQMKSVQSQQSIVIHVSVNLQLLLKTLQRNLNSQQQKNKKTTKKNKKTKQSYGFITFTLQCDAAQPLRNTVNHSFLWSQPAQNLQCHLGALPKGMSIHRGDCVCQCVNSHVWGHVAYWDNQIHSDSKRSKQRAILLSLFSYFRAVKESKDKDCRQRKLSGMWDMERKWAQEKLI